MSSLPMLSILIGRGPAGDAPAVGSRKRLDAVVAPAGESFADALEAAHTERPGSAGSGRRGRSTAARPVKPGHKGRPTAPGREVADRHRSNGVRSTAEAPAGLVSPDVTATDAGADEHGATGESRRATPATPATPAQAAGAGHDATTPATPAVPASPAAPAGPASGDADALEAAQPVLPAETSAAPVVTPPVAPDATSSDLAAAAPADPQTVSASMVSEAITPSTDPATFSASAIPGVDLDGTPSAIGPDPIETGSAARDSGSATARGSRAADGATSASTTGPAASSTTGPIAAGGKADTGSRGGNAGRHDGAAGDAQADGTVAPSSRSTSRGAGDREGAAADATTTGTTPAAATPAGRLAVHGTERAAEAITTAAADRPDSGAADRVLGQVIDRLRSFSSGGTPGLSTRFDDPDLGMLQLIVSGKAGDTVQAELVATDARSAEAIGRAIERAMATNAGLHGIALAVRTADASGTGPNGQPGSRQDGRPGDDQNPASANQHGAPTGDTGRHGSGADRSFSAIAGIEPAGGTRRRAPAANHRPTQIDAPSRPSGRPGVDVRA